MIIWFKYNVLGEPLITKAYLMSSRLTVKTKHFVKSVKVFADCRAISLRFGNPNSAGQGETERRERGRERARVPVAIVGKIGKD